MTTTTNAQPQRLYPSEMVAIKKALEPEIKKRSRDRMFSGKPSGNLPEGSTGQSRDQVADYVGVSGRTLEKAERVVDDGSPELVKAMT